MIPLPHSFLVSSLEEFMGNVLEDCLICPVSTVGEFLDICFLVSSSRVFFFSLPR